MTCPCRQNSLDHYSGSHINDWFHWLRGLSAPILLTENNFESTLNLEIAHEPAIQRKLLLCGCIEHDCLCLISPQNTRSPPQDHTPANIEPHVLSLGYGRLS